MKYGIKEEQWDMLCNVFANNPQIEKVILYGSRAKGTFKPFSDVDITLVGSDLSTTDLADTMNAIDDLLLPYMFDVSLYHNLKSPELLDHISRRGVVVYNRQSSIKRK